MFQREGKFFRGAFPVHVLFINGNWLQQLKGQDSWHYFPMLRINKNSDLLLEEK